MWTKSLALLVMFAAVLFDSCRRARPIAVQCGNRVCASPSARSLADSYVSPLLKSEKPQPTVRDLAITQLHGVLSIRPYFNWVDPSMH